LIGFTVDFFDIHVIPLDNLSLNFDRPTTFDNPIQLLGNGVENSEDFWGSLTFYVIPSGSFIVFPCDVDIHSLFLEFFPELIAETVTFLVSLILQLIFFSPAEHTVNKKTKLTKIKTTYFILISFLYFTAEYLLT